MEIAIVYDRVTKIGGAERVLQILHEIWPNAPLYTSLVNYKSAPWARVFKIKTSFLQLIQFLPHEILPNLMPLAFRSFNFEDYDVVVSVSSAEGKYIKVQKLTKHVDYCLTPTRYLWSGYFDYLKEPGFGIFNKIAKFFFVIFSPIMRMKDFEEARKIDKFVAISEEVARRIKKYYRRESEIVYPSALSVGAGLAPAQGRRQASPLQTKDYYLIVSRLVPYKQIDFAINVFNELPNKKLIIVGSGSDGARLKKIAKDNIMFKGLISDEDLFELYVGCIALIFPGIEDFGLTSLEAQAFVKPVICRKQGGTKETIETGKTGEIFETEEELKQIILDFDKNKYLKKDFENNLLKFSKEKFKKEFPLIVNNCIPAFPPSLKLRKDDVRE